LKEPSIREEIIDMIKEVIRVTISAHFVEDELGDDRRSELEKALSNLLGRNIKLENANTIKREALIESVEDLALKLYEEKEMRFTPEIMRNVEKYLLLRNIDSNWKDHLYAMDELKEGIGLRAYGQKDPLLEYQIESRALFDAMLDRIKYDTVFMLYRVELSKEEPKDNKKEEHKKKKR
jgi:Preprotein translocase subunit SecA (ATPase, RNA helicase)